VSSDRLRLGKSGENEALVFLKKNGYKILVSNYRTRLGEVDIIARDRDTFCFIEVKARRTLCCGSGAEAVSRLKQRQIAKAALQYLKENSLWDRKARFDVVSILFEGAQAKTQLIKNAYELDGRFSA
jgi:putative endonuclease